MSKMGTYRKVDKSEKMYEGGERRGGDMFGCLSVDICFFFMNRQIAWTLIDK